MRTYIGLLIATLTLFGCAKPKNASDGEKFVAEMAKFKQQYFAVKSNEAKESSIFQDARAFEKQYFADTTRIRDWKGTFRTFGTSKGGESLDLRVDACKDTFCVSFEADEQGRHDTVFKTLAEGNFAEGQCVIFSGDVRPVERSSTEMGAMKRPEYKMKFSALKLCP